MTYNDTINMFDTAVVGGGPGGYVGAIRLAQQGAKVVLIEKGELGGVCLNSGCIPTKTMIKTIRVFKELKESRMFGIEGIDIANARINISELNRRKQGIIKQLTGGVNGLLKVNGVTMIKGEAVMTEPDRIMVGDTCIYAKNIILATGSKPKLIPIPGIESQSVITSSEALTLEHIPESIIILGGGVIGVEFAIIFRELGTRVAVVEMMDRLLPTIDEEIALAIKNSLESMDIEIYTRAMGKEIKGNTLVFKKDGNEYEITGEKILISAGRVPAYDGIDIEKLRIKTENGAIVTDACMRTNIENVYAIGDVNGKMMLAHTASAEGIVAADNIMGIDRKMDYRYIPQCVYSLPEVASVGLTESQAREMYSDVSISRFPFNANGKALIENEVVGFVKVITGGKYKEVLGVHIVGPDAANLISEAVLAMNLECTADELAEIIHPHPTISEALQEAFHAASFKAVHCL